MSTAFLELKGLQKKFGDNTILEKLDLQVKEGEFLVLVGPSGCGKSTVLRLIAGLEEPTAGEVWISGTNRNGFEPKDRHIAMVFQHYALYPHMNVFDNMAFGLRVGKRLPEPEIAYRVNQAASMLQLENLLQRKPKELSGGQRQRVALGRALVRKPRVFLFDEPLSNLDAHLRNQMRVEIRKLQQRLGVTAIYVTHDQTEATTMGDRIAILQAGKLQQIGTPSEVYKSPVNRFVAGFIGTPEMNFLPAKAKDGKLVLSGWELPAPGVVSGEFQVGVRPEQVRLAVGSGGWQGKVELVENLGAHALVHVKMPGGETVMALQENDNLPPVNSEVSVSWAPAASHLFQLPSGKVIRSDA